MATFAWAEDAIETDASQALLIDLTTGTTLFEKAADQPLVPGSIAKLMTLEVIFEALRAGETTLETTYLISEHAWRNGGAPSRTTTMFAKLGSEVAVADLLRGIIVQNANDGSLAVAEGLAGSEQAFVDRMNERAASLGLNQSRFGNPTGLPGPETRMSPRDIASLAQHLIIEHSDLYPIFAEPNFSWNGIFQRSHTPLLGDGGGVDGLKAGFSEESKHSIVVSARRGGRRLLLVAGGLPSEKARDAEALALLRTGFEHFQAVDLFAGDETVASARVFGGTQGYVPLVPGEPVRTALAAGRHDEYRMRVVYRGPVAAPIRKGQQIGLLQLYRETVVLHEAPLYAGAEVAVGQLHQRAWDGARELLFGWW